MAEKLAIYGGPKAKTTPNYPMYPGGLEIGEAEKKEVMEVLDNKYLFRYYGPEGVESKVRKFEEHFKAKMGAKHCLATSSCTGALLSALTACGIGPGCGEAGEKEAGRRLAIFSGPHIYVDRYY